MKIINLKSILCIAILLACFINVNAQIKTNKEYDYIGNETNNAGLRVVGVKTEITTAYHSNGRTYSGEKKEILLYGCIDETGKEVIPLNYSVISISKDCPYVKVITPDMVTSDNKYWSSRCGLFSEDGKHTLTGIMYKDIKVDPVTFSKHKCAIFISQKDHYGIVNSNSEEIIPPVYDQMYWINNEKGYLATKLNGLWGIIDTKGQEIITPQWDYMEEKESDDELTLVHKDNNGYGFINSEGNLIIPTQYSKFGKYFSGNRGEQVYSLKFMNGLVILAKNYGKESKSGALDNKNHVIIPFEYDILYGFNGWSMWGRKGDQFFLISNNGVVLRSMNQKSYYEYSEEATEIGMVKTTFMQKDKYSKKNQKYYDDFGREYSSLDNAVAANKTIRSADIDRKKKKDIIQKEKTLPVLEWQNIVESVSQKEYELKVNVKSDTKITNVSVSVNDTQDRGIKTVNNTGFDMVITRTLSLSEGKNVIRVSVTNEAGSTQEEKTLNCRPGGKDLPIIDWLDFASTASKQDYLLKLGIKSKSKIEDVSITLNGQIDRGVKTTESAEYDMTVNRTITLSEGTNRIVVSVRNAEGISTSEKVITYKGTNPTPIINERRIALIIGNSHYSNTQMNLANPENDATDVAKKLEGLGFEVMLLIDAQLEQIDQELSAFAEKAREYEVALFFYAGHGIQSKGINFILPTNIDNLTEDNIRYKCVDSGRVLDAMEHSNCKLKIVVLDACRNDPVSRSWHRSTASRGLSMMDAPSGTIISFSTSPGHTAQDGKGRNSPYTEAFLQTLDTPNLDALHFFQTVGASVQQKTQRSQIPWLSSSFTGDFFFNKQ